MKSRDLRGVAVYIDDITVSVNNAQKHLDNLKAQFRCLNEKGLHCNPQKCMFAQSSVEYLEHTLSKDGLAKGSKCYTQDATANRCGNTEIFYVKTSYNAV